MAPSTVVRVAGGLRRRLAGKPWQGVDVELSFARIGTEYGGYGVLLEGLSERTVVYSVGLGEDISFDLGLIAATSCQVFGFDPTPRSIAWVRAQEVPPSFSVQELGVADYDGVATFAPPPNPQHVSHSMVGSQREMANNIRFQVRRVGTLMKELGHSRIDILKLDVEGVEYAVLDNMLSEGVRPSQLLVEFHHGMHGIPVKRTDAALSMLRRAGYRVFDAQPSGREFSLTLSERSLA